MYVDKKQSMAWFECKHNIMHTLPGYVSEYNIFPGVSFVQKVLFVKTKKEWNILSWTGKSRFYEITKQFCHIYCKLYCINSKTDFSKL